MKRVMLLALVLIAAPCWAIEMKGSDVGSNIGTPVLTIDDGLAGRVLTLEQQGTGTVTFMGPELDTPTLTTQEIEDSLALAVKLLNKSTDLNNTLAIYVSPAQQLRDQADAMEERDKEVQRIRDVYEAVKKFNQAEKGKL